jgi:hypothetical protein
MAHEVPYLIGQVSKTVGDYIDVTLTKENTNTKTEASVIVDGTLLVTLPAPALLNLEARLAEIHDLYEAIPTVDPTERWEEDSTGYLKAGPYEKTRTKKMLRTHVMYDATKEHPAQVETYYEDVPSYRIQETVWNSMLTGEEKALRLERIEQLHRVVKAARLRANDIDVERVKVSEKIFNFIETGVFE